MVVPNFLICLLKIIFFVILVTKSGGEFHVFIALHATVRLRKLVFALGNNYQPSVACLVACIGCTEMNEF